MNLNFIPKFTRLQALQLCRRQLFLIMLGNDPKIACKVRLIIRRDFANDNSTCIKLNLHNQAKPIDFSP